MNRRTEAKTEHLRESGSLNGYPQNITDEQFKFEEFFDPRDMVQVKYEMLRRVRIDGWSVTRAAAAFGFSRVAFYQIQKTFAREGLPGLIRKPKGPQRAHKLSAGVMTFILQRRARDKTIRASALAQLVGDHFGLSVHPRSIERAIVREQKKGR